MRKLFTYSIFVTLFITLIFFFSSCKRKISESSTTPSSETVINSNQADADSSRQILVVKDAIGNITIKLIGEGKDGSWSLIDDRNDIEIKKLDNDIWNVKANITVEANGSSSINTRIKAKPGEVVVLGGIVGGIAGGMTISLECPPN